MRLTDLNPAFFRAGGSGISDRDGQPVPERTGCGLVFNCPCGCGARQAAHFRNPIDGGPPIDPDANMWNRTGDTFETLSLTPSILFDPAKGGCGWHGYITNGEVSSC